jgi:hypothetical protein
VRPRGEVLSPRPPRRLTVTGNRPECSFGVGVLTLVEQRAGALVIAVLQQQPRRAGRRLGQRQIRQGHLRRWHPSPDAPLRRHVLPKILRPEPAAREDLVLGNDPVAQGGTPGSPDLAACEQRPMRLIPAIRRTVFKTAPGHPWQIGIGVRFPGGIEVRCRGLRRLTPGRHRFPGIADRAQFTVREGVGCLRRKRHFVEAEPGEQQRPSPPGPLDDAEAAGRQIANRPHRSPRRDERVTEDFAAGGGAHARRDDGQCRGEKEHGAGCRRACPQGATGAGHASPAPTERVYRIGAVERAPRNT